MPPRPKQSDMVDKATISPEPEFVEDVGFSLNQKGLEAKKECELSITWDPKFEKENGGYVQHRRRCRLWLMRTWTQRTLEDTAVLFIHDA